jgi:DNA-binding NarL/FixJ family response regulator
VDNKWYIAGCLVGFGALATAQGEWAWAVRLLGAAEARCEEIGALLPPALHAMQEFTVAAARAQLGEETFRAVWAEGRIMTLEQTLAAQGPVTMPTTAPIGPSMAPHAPKASTYPDGLTGREVEVLPLVAQGLTNEQVAQRLIIIPRTVNTHLTSIYSKIGVSSHSTATRYAIEHNLV